jgi:hypothetical protein
MFPKTPLKSTSIAREIEVSKWPPLQPKTNGDKGLIRQNVYLRDFAFVTMTEPAVAIHPDGLGRPSE